MNTTEISFRFQGIFLAFVHEFIQELFLGIYTKNLLENSQEISLKFLQGFV